MLVRQTWVFDNQGEKQWLNPLFSARLLFHVPMLTLKRPLLYFYQFMNSKFKIPFVILIAVLLTGIGYFGVFKAKKIVEPFVNTSSKTEVIDTSDWQTYRNETLGFEIKMPKDWTGGYYLGRRIPDDPEFWQDQVGGADFNGLFRGTSSPQFSVRVKDSDLTLDRFINVVGINREHQNIFIAGLPAKQDILDGRKDKYPNYREIIVTKNGQRNYVFYFDASDTDINRDILIWNEILKTFKPIP